MNAQNTRLGIFLMIATTFVFAVQDAMSRHLASHYDVRMIVMVRYWAFAAFAVYLVRRKYGSVRQGAQTRQPFLQILRGVLLASEICVMVVAFTKLGLVESHATFTSYPLLIAALSGPILGEKVGWRRWTAIGVGFVGVILILEPGFGVFKPEALWAIVAALLFALYGLLTRYVSRQDSSLTSFFWTGIAGVMVMTAIGPWYWSSMTAGDWALMIGLCVTGTLSHYMLIRTYELAEASAVQPFAYFQLFFGSILGITIFNDVLRPNVAAGALLVVGSGLFTLWRENRRLKREV